MGSVRSCGRVGRWRTGLIALGAVAAVAWGMWGCGSSPRGGGSEEPIVAEPPLESRAARELRSLAESQRSSPDVATLGSELPPELRADVSPDSRRSLAEVLSGFEGVSAVAASEGPTAWDAVRQYVTARERLGAGDAAGAVSLLQSALRLDPDAPALWRELGVAQQRQGNTAAALAAFQEAARRGLNEPRVFWILARDAHASGRHEDAARLLARARACLSADADPGLPLLVDALLGEALLGWGRTAAGVEALQGVLGTSMHSAGGTAMRLEVAELFRRRGELWLATGDALARLERFDEALEAYEHATSAGLFDGWTPVSRALAVLFHRGRTAEAALMLLKATAQTGGLVDDRVFPHLRRLSSSVGVRALAEEVLARIESLPGERTPTMVSRLARARASLVPGAESASRLRAHLRAMPGDDEALRAAMAWRAASGPRATAATELCDLALAVVRADPLLAERVGAALADSGPSPGEILSSLRARRSGEGVLLTAAVQLHLDLAGSAWETLAGVAWDAGRRAAGESLAARAAFESGRFAEALALAESLRAEAAKPGASPDSRLGAAAALHAARRSAEAADLLRGWTAAEAPAEAGARRRHIDALLMRAEYMASAERTEEAADLLRGIVGLDPHDERAYRALLTLHAPGGPLADAARFAETMRQLRQHNPNARLFRWIEAHEHAQRHLWSRAEPLLRELAEDDPTDGPALGLLATAWERMLARAQSAEAELAVDPLGWLERRAESRWGAPSDLAARVRVLAALDRGEEALALLEGVEPALPAWSILRERILREHLGRAAEAEELMRARLIGLPRPIGATLELTEWLLRAGRAEESAAVLAEGLPPKEVPLSGVELSRLVNLAGWATQGAMESSRTEAAASAALALLRIAVDRGAVLPAELHQARLTLLLAAPLINTSELASAALSAARQHPQPGSHWELMVAAQLGSGPHRSRTPAYLRRVVEETPSPPGELVFEYFRAVGLLGDVEEASILLSRMTETERIREILSRFSDHEAPLPDTGASPEARLRAELAYRLGNLAYLAGDTERAARIYEIGLSFDPSHAWLCNDLGYHWVETDRNLDRAAELLERAYAQMSDRASIVDSLGWLRYRRGQLHDGVDDRGRAVAGAVSLLSRAASLDDGADNATILDHLGDALWRVGERSAAVDRWTQAETYLRRQLQIIRGSTGFPAWEAQRLQDLQRSVSEKIRSAREGREPAVAPLSSWKPPADPPR